MTDLREVVLDTETTGLNVKDGHKIIEIGCVELINRTRTGNTLHFYLNPQREVSQEAFEIHGLSNEFLKEKPLFSSIARQLLEFLGTSNLVIHNAIFDMRFINQELALSGMPVIPMDRAIDTLTIARKKFPGAQASLDALCRKFNISLESRNKHGALIDSELLALVYIELTGSKQSTMHLTYYDNFYNAVQPQKNKYAKRSFSANSEEIELHEKMLAKIKNSMWKKSKDII